jgi:GTP-binding protein EngB required for normal cell division
VIGRVKGRAAPDLADRLTALHRAVELATDRLDPAAVESARVVAGRAGERLGLGADQTVAALAGATGSGKSSLFNTVSGVELSTTGVRRPTTSTAHACVWGGEGADELLDWLGVGTRHRLDPAADEELAGLVLLDLPDHDSTQQAHRIEVDRLVELVDLLVWVLDPQKYADAAVHDRYLRPLSGHAAVMVVVLNQVDLLTPAARDACLTDLRRLLAADGLPGVPIIATSTRTGEGLGELRAVLAERVAARQAAADRLSADVDREARRLVAGCAEDARPRDIDRRGRQSLVTALSSAAGADVVVDAVQRQHRQDASGMTGWPFVSWVRKLRPDPLRRLHLSTGAPNEAARTSLPEASGVQRARVSNAIRDVAGTAADPLPDPWPGLARRAAARHEADLPDLLDRAVAGTRLTSGRRPVWWAVVHQVQRLLALATVVGALWLLVLFVLSYFQLPDPPTPRVREIPWPTLLLLGGVLLGWLVAVVSRQAAKVGARRRGRLARRRLDERIDGLADEHVIAPLQAELSAYDELCTVLARARGGA